MTNTELKRETFLKATARRNATMAGHHGYSECTGKHQDDLNEMLNEGWIFTDAFQKAWDAYSDYFERGIHPNGMNGLTAKEIEKRLEKKMDSTVQAEFRRYAKASY